MFENRVPNKFEWWYKFLFIHEPSGEVNMYQIKTNKGFKFAEYYAHNNMKWDGGSNLKYIGKNKVEVENGTNA